MSGPSNNCSCSSSRSTVPPEPGARALPFSSTMPTQSLLPVPSPQPTVIAPKASLARVIASAASNLFLFQPQRDQNGKIAARPPGARNDRSPQDFHAHGPVLSHVEACAELCRSGRATGAGGIARTQSDTKRWRQPQPVYPLLQVARGTQDWAATARGLEHLRLVDRVAVVEVDDGRGARAARARL